MSSNQKAFLQNPSNKLDTEGYSNTPAIDIKSISQILNFQKSNFNLSPQLACDLLAHPLQLQIGFYEIHANMWVRNGMQMKGQAMTYVQNHFCTSFSDADLFLIQLLASRIEANLFMDIFLERFHIFDWLKDTIKGL